VGDSARGESQRFSSGRAAVAHAEDRSRHEVEGLSESNVVGFAGDEEPVGESHGQCHKRAPAVSIEVQAIEIAQVLEERLPRALRADVERSYRATFAPGSESVGFDETAVAAITQPTLLVHCDDDRIVPLESSESFAKLLPTPASKVRRHRPLADDRAHTQVHRSHPRLPRRPAAIFSGPTSPCSSSDHEPRLV
jgi:pimeloyl-ACP methyl ester carboxylesterase